MQTDSKKEKEALRLKAIAETKFRNLNFKSALKHAKKAHRLAPKVDGLSSMLTAFEILRIASESSSDSTKDWYKILQVEPFCHINTIKKQYRKLALVLHPDKNQTIGCEEAFKLVGEGFRVLSDKIRRKEYDMRLRIKMQEDTIDGMVEKEVFWTACSRCRLLHQFERRYLGHNLVCPSCKKSFKAVEVDEGGEESKEETVGFTSVRTERSKQKKDSVEKSKEKMSKKACKGKESDFSSDVKVDDAGESSRGSLRSMKRKTSSVGEVLARSKLKDAEVEEVSEEEEEVEEEMMTLAEMQSKLKLNLKKKVKEREEREVEMEEKEMETNRTEILEDRNLELDGPLTKEMSGVLETRKRVISEKSADLGSDKQRAGKKSKNLEVVRQRTSKRSGNLAIERRMILKNKNLEIMAVEDSDFYDFDKDRSEKSFRKGQVWAIYDDDDGMPRHYGLVDEIVSLNPFEVKISWLDLQNNGEEKLISWESLGFHVSCGRFKVSRKTPIKKLNIFSHVVDCERAAREVYRIYPKKGSIWALYNEAALGAGGANLSASDRRSYDIVVFLTTYSDMHGLSMAYLEKVDGYKAVFKRREIGVHAIRWLEKDDVRLFSHHIPARRLTGDEIPDILKGCWELDPASLPQDLLTIGWGR